MTNSINTTTTASNGAENGVTSRTLNLWAVYGICLLISTVFFFLFGFNSPIFTFNSDWDYQWYMTMGHGLLTDKLPYRDLFEHKGPLVYFVAAFCCLFKDPSIVMFIIEIICMSLFFFFAYKIACRYLNTFYALVLVPILALAVFTSWCRMGKASAIEQYCFPIYAYFLLCWLEFIADKRQWNWTRALLIGLGFGIIFWSKYTLLYFMIAPMVIWLVLSLRACDFRNVIINLLMMLAGVVIISLPNIIFFTANHALDDMLRVYFLVNMTAYGTTTPWAIIKSFLHFFLIGPLVLFLIVWGIVRFAIRHWHERTGWLVLIAFLVNWGLLLLSCKGISYYFSGLFPYAIFGIADLLSLVQNKLTLPRYRKCFYTAIAAACVVICIPCCVLTYEWGHGRDKYTPLVVADIINEYGTTNNTAATLFCYKTGDFGFYNAAGIVPNNYYYSKNYFSEEDFPAMYEGFHTYITEQTSDFVVTFVETWDEERDFLSQYYQPYTRDENGDAIVYHYRRINYFYYTDYDFVLLYKI